jgi:hypothetical protein
MPEERLAIRPAEFLHLECPCSQCKNVTAISLNPPKDDLDESLGSKAARQCMWCRAPFPLGMASLIKKIQEDFSMLQAHPEFDLRFVVKQ